MFFLAPHCRYDVVVVTLTSSRATGYLGLERNKAGLAGWVNWAG
jgi:hypothetical protein